MRQKGESPKCPDPGEDEFPGEDIPGSDRVKPALWDHGAA